MDNNPQHDCGAHADGAQASDGGYRLLCVCPGIDGWRDGPGARLYHHLQSATVPGNSYVNYDISKACHN